MTILTHLSDKKRFEFDNILLWYHSSEPIMKASHGCFWLPFLVWRQFMLYFDSWFDNCFLLCMFWLGRSLYMALNVKHGIWCPSMTNYTIYVTCTMKAGAPWYHTEWGLSLVAQCDQNTMKIFKILLSDEIMCDMTKFLIRRDWSRSD